MIIALYPSHHMLPFWHSPQQPTEVFDPKRHHGRKVVFDRKSVHLRKFWLWPILKGLHMVDLPVMAHISTFYQNTVDKKWHLPKRSWIQITTLPTTKDSNGIPIVIDNGIVTVKHLWGGDNGTYTPYQLLGKESIPEEETPEFWRDFIIGKLREVKVEAQHAAADTLQKAQETEALFAAIPA